jgi:hypothetical protein
VLQLHAALEAARAPQEGDAVAVRRVHVAWILKTKPENGSSVGDHAHGGVASRGRGPVQQRIEDLAHAEVVDGRTEEHRRLHAGQEFFQVERMRGAMHQFHFHLQLFDFQREHLSHGIVDALDDFEVAVGASSPPAEHDLVAQQVHATEVLAHADRPGHRRTGSSAPTPAHPAVPANRGSRGPLVHEGDDGRVAHAADVQQLDGLFFHALGGVDHHQRRVHGGQHAVGIFSPGGPGCRAG